MELRRQLLTENRCYIRGDRLSPKGVMVHSTGANNPNLRRYVQPDDGALGTNRYGNDWNQPEPSVCVHAFIGRLQDGTVAVYQTLPWQMRGWHAGRGARGSANDTHIGFELCEDDLSDPAYFAAVYRAAVELTAFLCRRYGLDPSASGVVIDHAEGCALGIASNHGDIGHWLRRYGKTMDDFRNAVREEAFEMRYRTLKDLRAQGAYYLPTVERLLRQGILRGKGGTGEDTVLDLGEDSLRLLVLLDRAGLLPRED